MNKPITFAFVTTVSVILCAHTAVPAGAQQTTQIQGDALCTGCTVILDSVTVLNGRRGDYVGQPLALARLSDGRWLLSAMHDPTRIVVFDKHGNFSRVVGRRGNGPGEYRFIRTIIVGGDDTIRVFDLRQGRLTVLSPTFEYVRSKRVEIPRAIDLEVLADGRIITVQDIPTVKRAGLPLHILGSDGAIIRSFGAINPTYRRAENDLHWRSIAPVPDRGRVWVAHLVQYKLELWGFNGRKYRTLVRNVPWFQSHDNYGIDFDKPNVAPNPGIVEIHLDAKDRLWVPIHVPDENWQQALGPVPGLYGQEITGVKSPDQYFDTIIEIIDPAQARLIASARFERKLHLVGETNFVWSYREDRLGFPFVYIWRLRVSS